MFVMHRNEQISEVAEISQHSFHDSWVIPYDYFESLSERQLQISDEYFSVISIISNNYYLFYSILFNSSPFFYHSILLLQS